MAHCSDPCPCAQTHQLVLKVRRAFRESGHSIQTEGVPLQLDRELWAHVHNSERRPPAKVDTVEDSDRRHQYDPENRIHHPSMCLWTQNQYLRLTNSPGIEQPVKSSVDELLQRQDDDRDKLGACGVVRLPPLKSAQFLDVHGQWSRIQSWIRRQDPGTGRTDLLKLTVRQ